MKVGEELCDVVWAKAERGEDDRLKSMTFPSFLQRLAPKPSGVRLIGQKRGSMLPYVFPFYFACAVGKL